MYIVVGYASDDIDLIERSEIYLGPLLQGQTRIAKLKSAYNVLIIGPRGLGW